ncbi:hypothetical protein [Isoptericola aurantiacus]|uniref:hypothetical protein n=1 Tax=Isoptericola aurantiacus TaxID=3377839 RepID=UPI003839F1EA
MVLADVRLREEPPDVLTVSAREDGFGFLAPFGNGWYRFIGWHGETDLDDTVDLAEARAAGRLPGRRRGALGTAATVRARPAAGAGSHGRRAEI